jgi:hypothetical protein
MSYEQWIDRVKNRLTEAEFDAAVIDQIFKSERAILESFFRAGDYNDAGVHFVQVLESHDLDLRVARVRGEGTLDRDVAAIFDMTKEQARASWTRGSQKKVAILLWFRDCVEPDLA